MTKVETSQCWAVGLLVTASLRRLHCIRLEHRDSNIIKLDLSCEEIEICVLCEGFLNSNEFVTLSLLLGVSEHCRANLSCLRKSPWRRNWDQITSQISSVDFCSQYNAQNVKEVFRLQFLVLRTRRRGVVEESELILFDLKRHSVVNQYKEELLIKFNLDPRKVSSTVVL